MRSENFVEDKLNVAAGVAMINKSLNSEKH